MCIPVVGMHYELKSPAQDNQRESLGYHQLQQQNNETAAAATELSKRDAKGKETQMFIMDQIQKAELDMPWILFSRATQQGRKTLPQAGGEGLEAEKEF